MVLLQSLFIAMVMYVAFLEGFELYANYYEIECYQVRSYLTGAVSPFPDKCQIVYAIPR